MPARSFFASAISSSLVSRSRSSSISNMHCEFRTQRTGQGLRLFVQEPLVGTRKRDDGGSSWVVVSLQSVSVNASCFQIPFSLLLNSALKRYACRFPFAGERRRGGHQ